MQKQTMYAHPTTKSVYDDSALCAGLAPKQIVGATNHFRERYDVQLGCMDYEDANDSRPWGERFENPALLSSLVED